MKYRTPNLEGVLYAVSSITGEAEFLYSTNNVLDTTGGGGGGGGVQYTEGDIAPAAGTGTLPVFINSGFISQVTESVGLPVSLISSQTALRIQDSNGSPITSVQTSSVSMLNSAIGAQYLSTPPTYPNGDINYLQMDTAGKLLVSTTIAGTVAVTQSGTWSVRNQDGSGNTISSTANALDTNVKSTNLTQLTEATVILNGKTTVTTAGTRVVLAASTACKQVVIRALSANTGVIYVGSSTVASTNGYTLTAGESIGLEIANLNTVNIDSSVNGEGVVYLGSV